MIERIISDFASWHWWITVVIVGLLVNLGSAYLKDPLDRLFAHRSATRMRRRIDQETMTRAHVKVLLADRRLLALHVAKENRLRQGSISLLHLCLLTAISASAVGSRGETGLFNALATGALAAMAILTLGLSLYLDRGADNCETTLTRVESGILEAVLKTEHESSASAEIEA
jgi:hypothetical protein